MDLKEVVTPLTYLKDNSAEVIHGAAESGCLLAVTQNSEAKAVVMCGAPYDEWKCALTLLKILAQGAPSQRRGDARAVPTCASPISAATRGDP
jgi:hypothetical protein